MVRRLIDIEVKVEFKFDNEKEVNLQKVRAEC